MIGLATRNIIGTLLLTLCTAMPAWAQNFQKDDIVVESPWSQATPPMSTVGAGYMLIRNLGFDDDALISVTSPVSDRTEFTEKTPKTGNQHRVKGPITVPSNGDVEFKPDGIHVTFYNLKEPLHEGEMIPAVLHFSRSGDVAVTFVIEPANDEQNMDSSRSRY